MNIRRITALCLVLLLFASCGSEKAKDREEFIGEENSNIGEIHTDTQTEQTEDPDSMETVYEAFFSVEEYDYTNETDPEILAYFDQDIGGALTRLAPAAKAAAYAAYCYPDALKGAPNDQIIWCALYSTVVSFRQLPGGSTTTADGQVIINGSDKLSRMAKDIFTADIGEIGEPHEDFRDSLIFYDADSDTYTFEPSGGEGLEIRICALEAGSGDSMRITVQLYNSIFDFTSWVSLTITKNPASAYGYTVSDATAWNEEI